MPHWSDGPPPTINIDLGASLTSLVICAVCTALTALCKLISPDLINAVLPGVTTLLSHPKEIVRKKAVMALHRFQQLDPDHDGALSGMDFGRHYRQALCDKVRPAYPVLQKIAVVCNLSCSKSLQNKINKVANSALPASAGWTSSDSHVQSMLSTTCHPSTHLQSLCGHECMPSAFVQRRIFLAPISCPTAFLAGLPSYGHASAKIIVHCSLQPENEVLLCRDLGLFT